MASALRIFFGTLPALARFKIIMPKNRKAELTSAVKRFYDLSPRAICFAERKTNARITIRLPPAQS
jgi:hypothetical protein